jgi:hypothetical protein
MYQPSADSLSARSGGTPCYTQVYSYGICTLLYLIWVVASSSVSVSLVAGVARTINLN